MEEKENLPASFVQTLLPPVVSGAALLLYLFTLNHWVTLNTLPVVAKVAGWDWWTMTLQQPLFYALTYPVRWLPAAWQPLALNAFSAMCAALTLGLLARSVALLPHDRTRDQRQRERGEYSLLSIPAAWLPPVLAVLGCGLQSSFWEQATGATGDMLSLLLMAYLIRCLLEYRIDDRFSWVSRFAFVYGLALANNWAMIVFLPGFLVAFFWIQGLLNSLQTSFLLRLLGWGALGLSLYLLLPLTESLTYKSGLSFLELLRIELAQQRDYLLSMPRGRVLLAGLTSFLPVLVMGIKEPKSLGDTSLVSIFLTKVMFKVIHGLFLAACLGVMFDPPFSPKALGATSYFFLPVLPLYYLSALGIGYFSGYFLLVFGTEPERRRHRSSGLQRILNRGLAGLVWIALAAVPAGLIYLNLPMVRANQNSPLLPLATTLAQSLPSQGAMVLSDEPTHLLLAEAGLDRLGLLKNHVFIDTRSLPYHVYHRNLLHRYPHQWPDVVNRLNLSNPIEPFPLLQLMLMLARSNNLVYLHPFINYYGEGLSAQAYGLIFTVKPYSVGSILPPPPTEEALNANRKFWSNFPAPMVQTLQTAMRADKPTRISDAQYAAISYSRAANYWGVELQKSNQLEPAGSSFQLALELSPSNWVAQVNRDFNAHLRTNQAGAFAPNPGVAKLIAEKYRRWGDLLRENGPFDEPWFTSQTGEQMATLRPALIRQAAHQFIRVQQLQPNNHEAGIWLANLYLQWRLPDRVLGVVSQMRQNLGTLPERAVRLELVRLEAWALNMQTNLPAAEKVLEAAQTQYPEEPSLPETLAQVYLKNRQFTNALTALEQQLRLDPNNLGARANQGALYIQLKNYTNAIGPLNQVLQAQPDNSAARMNRAIALLQSGKLDEAELDYQELLKEIPHLHRAYFGLAQIAYQRQHKPKAIEYYELYLKHVPRDARNEPEDPAEAKFVNDRLKELKPGSAGG